MKQLRTTATILTVASLVSACGIAAEHRKYDYKGPSGTATAKPLEVPPDLSAIPAGGLALPREGAEKAASVPVLPAIADVSVERDGQMRWLVVKRPADQVWDGVRQFWKEQGFELEMEDAKAGVMQTGWAEDYSRKPNDLLNRSIGGLFSNLFSSGQKDRFRARLERRQDGTVEVFVSHQAKAEEFVDTGKSEVRWFARPSDPEAEAFMLSRLMQRLAPAADVSGVSAALVAVSSMATSPAGKLDGATTLELPGGFDRTWRRVGLELDRNGFTVIDRDRLHGLYFIRYADPDVHRSNGVLGFLFGDKDTRAEDFQLEIVELTGKCMLRVLDGKGQPSTSATAKRIIGLLREKIV